MAKTLSATVDQPVADDLISYLKAIPDGRYRRGMRYPQWFLLLVAVLGILSGCRSSRDLEAFARRHRQALNQALGLDFKRWPSDATFFYLFNKAHLQTFGDVFQACMFSQIPGGGGGFGAARVRRQDAQRLSGGGRGRRSPLCRPGHGLCPGARCRPGSEGLRHPRIQRTGCAQRASEHP